MPAIIAPIGSAAPEAGSEGERVREAGQRMMDVFPRKRFWLLGRGSEAVVFTDGSTVYKVFDYWKTSMSRAQIRFLQGQTGRWGDAPGLYALRDVVEYGTTLILTYDYESSVPYEGGRESDLIRLLDGCRAVGIVCNNVHPKNLIVTPSGVKLIDYGSDIRPWNPLGFEHMARRAFLACRHAGHRDLPFLMGRALRDTRFPEMADYGRFRAALDGGMEPGGGVCVPSIAVEDGACRQCPRLYVGIISSDPTMLGPLLECLASLRDKCAQEPVALVLDNGSPTAELDALVRGVRDQGLQIAVVDEAQQRGDAASGGFGAALRDRPQGQVGIARARTMLQRYLGSVMATDPGSFGWVLDDDMRVDGRALAYLPWLPFFREQGTSVLIGAYEGASPNPPLNGLRVQLLDIYHNIHWLKSLPGDAILPDRSEENAALRRSYPDYYYDLSRKHTAHLEMPHWLEPIVPGERVSQAYSRLVAGSLGILCGTPLTRPIVSTMPTNPLASAKDSVNRGGCTFILNHRALTETPNLIPRVRGREARRSDMVWAILNRHYRRMTIKAVAFPVHHVGRVSLTPSLDIEKVQGEIVGSTLYGAMSDFLRTRSYHELDLSSAEIEEICHLADRHLERRWRMLEHSFHRIAGLREAIRAVGEPGELRQLVAYLDEWFTPETLDRIRFGVETHNHGELRNFLGSLREVTDDYAAATVNIDFLQAQLRNGTTRPARW